MSPTYRDPVYHMGGVPVQGEMPFILGSVYFVSSVKGSSAYDGKTKDFPFNTLARAIEFSTLNDCIVLMPGHTENIDSTTVFKIDSSHVALTVWGVGSYDYRPTFTLTGTSTNFVEVAGANFHLHNVKFVAGTSASIVKAFFINAKGCKLTNCRFEDTLASTYYYEDVILGGSTDNDVDGLEIHNCEFLIESSLAQTAIKLGGVANDVVIKGNTIYGNFSTGSLSPIYLASTKAYKFITIASNRILNNFASGTTATAAGITVLGDNSLAYIYDNYIAHAVGDSDTSGSIHVSATGLCLLAENYQGWTIRSGSVITPANPSTS